MPQDQMVGHTSEELAIPIVQIQDLEPLRDGIYILEAKEKELLAAHNQALRDLAQLAQQEIKGAIKRARKRIWRPSRNWLGTYEIEYLDRNFFLRCDDISGINEQLVGKLYPQELRTITDDSKGIKSLDRLLEPVIEEDQIFLNYFFLTPVNRSDWERFWREIVPVTEKSRLLFGLYSETRVRGFEKSGHEQGTGQMENMQMIPFALQEQHIDFYMNRIFSAVNYYNAKVGRFAEMLSKLGTAKAPQDPHLEMDVSIMNFCLEQMPKKPYSPATGMYAIQLGTATRRIEKKLQEVTGQLHYAAQRILYKAYKTYKRGFFEEVAKELGFRMRYDQWEEYASRIRTPDADGGASSADQK